jgi:hypothetical protein
MPKSAKSTCVWPFPQNPTFSDRAPLFFLQSTRDVCARASVGNPANTASRTAAAAKREAHDVMNRRGQEPQRAGRYQTGERRVNLNRLRGRGLAIYGPDT